MQRLVLTKGAKYFKFDQKFAKSRGSMRRLEQPKPRYGPSPFSRICLLLLKDPSFNLFIFTVHP